MTIAFWSNTHGLCCNSTHLGIISIWYALRHPDAHCAILENHKTPCGIDRMLYRPLASESQVYYRSGGVGTLIRRLGKGELSLLDLEFMAERFIGERLIYFPVGADMGPEQLEYHWERNADSLFSQLERWMDHVWIDTSSTAGTTRMIRNKADRVVISLAQNRTVLDNLFHTHRELHRKAFYILGNYEAESDLTRDEIVSQYGIDGKRIAVIPRDVEMMDAISHGALIPYVMQCYHCEAHEESFAMARAMREAMDAVLDWLGEEETSGVYDLSQRKSTATMVADGGSSRYVAGSGQRNLRLCESVSI